MDSDDEVLVILAAYVAAKENEDQSNIKGQSKRRRPNCWVNPYLQLRKEKGRFQNDFQNMVQNPSMFYQNFNMNESEFNSLFSLVEPHLVPKRNSRPDAIPLRAKLAIALEYFATGDLQCHVGSTYRISKQHMGRTIDLVSHAISTALHGEFPKWNSENMLKWATDFMEQWHFPNCIGAIDAKHVAIRAPPNSGNAFHNSKGLHSIMLMAVCDASYRFTYIDVGAYGSETDMTAFSHCSLGKAILSGNVAFPEDSMLQGVRTPYYMVADEAFQLHKRIMKPYGARKLSKAERIFNYRLSRARRCIEKAFGILSNRWMAVQDSLRCGPDRAQNVIVACCYLHNYLMRVSPREYGARVESPLMQSPADPAAESFRGRVQDFPKHVRNTIKDFVNSAVGSVPGQNESAGVLH
ncbi:putative nuclease HARBI1 [Drosophila subobscura]|uniref:putative nuclease HARBI1 n=1 Tax=Drosophila subobscura TaxID=7241 RepID=UPI00155B33E4|nr:putative nuclease HARBI1 [Drosophila subobscura]